jgi:hypothetical protein
LQAKWFLKKLKMGTTKANTKYQLDLYGVRAGSCLLKIKNGQDVSAVKIILHNRQHVLVF